MSNDPFDPIFYRILAALSAIALIVGLIVLFFIDSQPTNRQLAVLIVSVGIMIRVNLEAHIKLTAKRQSGGEIR